MKNMLAIAGLLILGGSLASILGACGSDTASSPGSPVAQTRSNPSTSRARSEGSSPARLDGDGRYFGYLRAVNGESDPFTISFDVAQFFFGKSAQEAAEEDGAVPPGEPVSNDHYERNADSRAETLTLPPDAQVTAAVPATRLEVSPKARARCGSGCDAIPVDLAVLVAAFQKDDSLSAAGDPVWVTIRNGLVVRIDEQYFP